MPSTDPAQALFEDLRGAWRRGRLAQGYVLAGSVRGEALELARRLVALLFCEADAEKAPCGQCTGCRLAGQDHLADVFFLEPVKVSQKIGVEEVRLLCSSMSRTAMAGGWKVGVLLYADRMTPEAANAFLKMLEEPPPKTLFLLLSEQPSGLLPTILSRCQRLVLPAGDAAITPWLETVAGLMRDAPMGALSGLSAAAAFGAGLSAIRERIEDVESENQADGEDDDKLKARVTARYKEERTVALRALLLWQRDLLAVAAGADPACLVYAGQADAIRDCASRLSVAQALARVEAVEEMQAQLEQNVSESLVLESGFARLFP